MRQIYKLIRITEKPASEVDRHVFDCRFNAIMIRPFDDVPQDFHVQPVNITFIKNLADFYYVELGRVEDAIKLYLKVLNINPKDKETLIIIGHICVSLKKFDDAKVFYDKVLQIDPLNTDARQMLDKLSNHEQGINQDIQENTQTFPIYAGR